MEEFEPVMRRSTCRVSFRVVMGWEPTHEMKVPLPLGGEGGPQPRCTSSGGGPPYASLDFGRSEAIGVQPHFGCGHRAALSYPGHCVIKEKPQTFESRSALVPTRPLLQTLQGAVVILMASNPKPREAVFSPECDGAVRSPNINCPDLSFALKPEGRMIRMSFEKLVLLDR